jgi:tetratricopeptide (TPR) repeat protein
MPHTAHADGETPHARLAAAIRDYQNALDALLAPQTKDGDLQVIQVLITRDRLADELARDRAASPEALSQISSLDQRLKGSATHIDAMVGAATLANWRDTYQPPDSAWWWRLDERAVAQPVDHPVLEVVAALLILAASISLTFEIARRFLASGATFLGVFTTVSTALLALVGGGAFTRVGRQGVERVIVLLKIQRKHMPLVKIGVALMLLLLIFAINRSLPAVAVLFNNHAQDLQQSRQFAGAIDNYLLAVNLDPTYVDSYYNLAGAYEDVQEYDKAIETYQQVHIVAPKGYYNLSRSYNNMARLYLVQRDDAPGALRLLNTAFNLNATEPDIQYALHKNRGWSYLKMNLLGPAETDLREAIRIDNNRPAAHCLLAHVLDARGDAASALMEWGDCLAYATPDRLGEAEDAWLATAKYRLDQRNDNGGGTK